VRYEALLSQIAPNVMTMSWPVAAAARGIPMDNAELFAKVVAILKPYVKDEESLKTATNDTKILDDLKVNSARLVDLILAMEDAFDIEIDDDAADKVRTLGNAVDVIAAKKEE
jgi:acyl carrier protein